MKIKVQPQSVLNVFFIVPAFSDQAGQCRVVARQVDGKIDAGASYRMEPELWRDAGLMNSRGKLVCLDDKLAFAEMAQDEPLSAGMQYSFPAVVETEGADLADEVMTSRSPGMRQ